MTVGLISSEPCVPKPYSAIADSSPPGSIPEAVYQQWCETYGKYGPTDPKVSRIVYTSDGLKITGMMAEPAAVRPRCHPIVIYNRGGNREFGKLTLLTAMRQLIPLARQGNLVYASNYRGNDGG